MQALGDCPRVLVKVNGGYLMKRLLLIISVVLILFAFSGCDIQGHVIRGSGVIITEQRDVSGFTEVDISVALDITIEQTGEESLELVGDDNILARITTEVTGNRLKIYLKDRVLTHLSPTEDIKARLTVKDISKIDLSGSAEITANDLSTVALDIDISGSAEVMMSNLDVDDLDIELSGSGKFKLSGRADVQSIDISGSGDYDARDLVSKECYISIAGSGDATVNVTDFLSVNVAGSGDVKYLGDPRVSYSVAISGSLTKLE